MSKKIIASAVNANTNIGIVSNMSTRMMAICREIDRRYEEKMNNSIDLPKIDKSKFKLDNYGDFDGECIIDIPVQNSRFVPFLAKDVVGYISNQLTRMHEASRRNNTGIDI